ncbi:MAG: glycosyltransferase [Chitinophagaceae bacterium]|nr:glycosyltransferase [Chitinophagaceae bacterium]
MNILRIIASMNPASGGPCQGIRNSIPELEKIGAHNEVVCLDDPQESFIKKDNFKIYALGSGKTAWRYNNKLVPWLQNNLMRFDVIIVHGLWLYNGFATLKAIKSLQKQHGEKIPRLFVMPHGMLDPYFQLTSGRKFKALRNNVYWRFIESKLIERADGVLFTTETELLLARTTFKTYKPKKELNVGYGIQEPPQFKTITTQQFYNKFPLLKNKSFFLFLSRIHNKKGVDLLLKAYDKILQQKRALKKLTPTVELFEPMEGQDNKLPLLVIAGPGLESAYGIRMAKMVTSSKRLTNSVVFTGMLSGNMKWEAFYNCEAMILPSHQENFGIAVIEALACSKPVLISNQVNTWREIQQHKAGIVAPNTLKGTLDLLDQWNSLTGDQKTQMGENAKECFYENFAIQPAARRLYKVLKDE